MPRIDQIGEAAQTRREVTFEWAIRDFFSLSDKSGDFYVGPRFSFADTCWQLTMYPNGNVNDSSEGWISLYLSRGASDPPKTINYWFGIKVSNGVEEKGDIQYLFSKDDEGHGFPKFLSRSDLKKRKSILMPNDVLTITCRLCCDALNVKGEKKCLQSLLGMLKSGDDSDVVIKVRRKKFRAHRNILRARSPVFRSMFSHEMAEKRSGVVSIEDCDPRTFHDFLVHIYSGGCDHISADNVRSLYAAADKYDVGELREACAGFMTRNITVERFCDVLALATRHGDKHLTKGATKFFCENSVNIAKTAEWQTFLTENPTAGNELFIKAMSK